MRHEGVSLAISRRTFLKVGGLGALGAFLGPSFAFAKGGKGEKRCIVLWMAGGPSHLDTFDPKPGTDTGGPFKAIEAAPGMRICEHLPRLAKAGSLFSIVRSVTSKEGDHGRADYLLHTGHLPQETVVHPALGAVVAKERGSWKQPLPPYVAVGGPFADPGFLGTDHAALAVDSMDGAGRILVVPEELKKERFARRLKVVGALDAAFEKRTDSKYLAEAVRAREATLKLLGEEAAEAFDLSKEPEKVRAGYGDSDFGKGCLLARRLVERGTRFVEVALGGWDTHANNFEELQKNLLPALDAGFSSLLLDLKAQGLLDDTLVLWMGEFGRTPDINADKGRDHHPDVFSVVVAGSHVPGGTVVGESDEKGAAPKERAVTVADLSATLLSKLGVDPDTAYTTPEGRPIQIVEKGKPIKELG